MRLIRGKTFNITYGVSNRMCDSRTVTAFSLSPRACVTATNSSISETPVTISGLIIGIFEILSTILRERFFKLLIPIAAQVPNSDANRAANRAITKVLITTPISSLLLKRFL